MQIRIPGVLVRAWDAFCDFGAIPLGRIGRFKVCRLDAIVVALFISCVGYYWITSGWRGAVIGGALFLFIGFLSLCAAGAFDHESE
jgi:hypothetical protein